MRPGGSPFRTEAIAPDSSGIIIVKQFRQRNEACFGTYLLKKLLGKLFFRVLSLNCMMRTPIRPHDHHHALAAASLRVLSGVFWSTMAFTCSALLLLVSGAVHGQGSSEFSLFEPVNSSNSESPASGRQNSRANVDATSREAEFILIGMSRIGRKTSVMLRHVSGEAVRVSLERPRMFIPGYEQYAVIGSDGETISIQYPQSVACREFVAQGISCDASRNVATLALTTAKAIVPPSAQTETAQSESELEERPPPTNPFEALRNRAQNGDPSIERTDRFQPRRIDPTDVPPGMRVLSTPFGDRLVEE